MRIVHIVTYCQPHVGYMEYYLAEKQKKMGHEVCIVTSDRYTYRSNARSKCGLFTEEGVEVFRLPSFKVWDQPFLSINGLRSFLKKFSPEIVHLECIDSSFAIPVTLWKCDIGYEVVANGITGMYMSKGFTLNLKLTLWRLYKRLLLTRIIERVNGFCAISESSASWLSDNLNIDQSKIHFIPLGADSSLFYPDHSKRLIMRENLGIEQNTVVAIYTGKIFPHKRIDTLLTACAPLLKAYDFKLLLVGAGPKEYLEYLKGLIGRQQISDSVLFHQWIHRTDLPNYYNLADFAVWPGHHSISILEAMSTGLPVIIPKSKWLNHLLEYANGFEYSEGDVEELRTCVKKLVLDEKTRTAMGHRSRKLIEDKLNWNTIAKTYLDLYQKIVFDQRKSVRNRV